MGRPEVEITHEFPQGEEHGIFVFVRYEISVG
jgi:hypothetical protein